MLSVGMIFSIILLVLFLTLIFSSLYSLGWLYQVLFVQEFFLLILHRFFSFLFFVCMWGGTICAVVLDSVNICFTIVYVSSLFGSFCRSYTSWFTGSHVSIISRSQKPAFLFNHSRLVCTSLVYCFEITSFFPNFKHSFLLCVQ